MAKGIVNYDEIAEACGVSRMTVSRAFTHRGRISEATRTRVLETAERLGYRRDPMLSALNQYRVGSDARKEGVVIAYLTDLKTPSADSPVPSYRRFCAGAQEEAHRLGYKLQEFRLRDFNHTADLRRVLLARGIQSLVIAPLIRQTVMREFHYESIAAVSLGLALDGSEKLDRVSHDHYNSIRLCGRTAADMGYARIGLVIDQAIDDRVECRWSAAYHKLPHWFPGMQILPPFVESPGKQVPRWRTRFHQWYQQHLPDCILTTSTTSVRTVFRRNGIAFPESVAVIGLDIDAAKLNSAGGREFAGIEQNAKEAGVYAVRILDRRFQNRETGLQSCPVTVQVQGCFCEGNSLPGRSRQQNQA